MAALQAVAPGVDALRALVGSGWQPDWTRHCGQPFRELPTCIQEAKEYQEAMTALTERGLGQERRNYFLKPRYTDLDKPARAFLKEMGVPAWSFRLHECDSFDAQTTWDTQSHLELEGEEGQIKAHRGPSREYNNILFNGAPAEPINDGPSLLKSVRKILRQKEDGDGCVRFKEEIRQSGKSISGSCNQKTCKGCTFRVLASLTVTAQGTPHLLVKTAGSHGNRLPPSGGRLWTDRERRILADAFPNGQPMLGAGIRAAFAAEGAPLHITAQQLKQFVTRENRSRRGQPAGHRPTVQDLLNMVQRWQASQAKTFAAARLTELRIVGSVISTVDRTFFAWTTRGFLNHLKGRLTDPICLAVDGKQKISRSGAVIATIGILSTSAETRNTSVSRGPNGERLQMQLKTSNVLPLLQAYMNVESIDNYVELFRTLCDLVKEEFDVVLAPKVFQLQADFDDSIEAARRKVFYKSRPANDYPHMMRAAYATLTKKTTAAGRQRVVNLIRNARHLPTLEIFSAVWETFLQELQTADMPGVAKYLEHEYLQWEDKTTLQKHYDLRAAEGAQLLWAAYWAGVLGIQPGTATGTQALEAFHSFWQRQIQHKARAQPTEILSLMQGLFDGQWSTWMRADDSAEAAINGFVVNRSTYKVSLD